MSKFIKPHSISIGYNNTGQEFFDIIFKYRKFIHSYFLSFNESMTGMPYNFDDVVSKLKKCNNFNIPANILFNTINDESYESIIDLAKNIMNVTDVTVFKISTAIKIKEKYPELKIHLSVRYFDWSMKPTNELMEDLLINDVYKIIDTINISGARSYTDHNLMDFIHNLGIKVKIITNESCIINRSSNYQDFSGFEKLNCYNSPCNKICIDVISKYKWMQLCRINMVKEMIQYYNIDILKLSTRNIIDNSYIDDLLYYWTSDDKTDSIYPPNGKINISDKYEIFLEWCKVRSTCDGYCYNCKKCKDYYDKFIS